MTPQLQQAIKMLQLSNLELTQYIDAEIQQNPLLERREPRLEEPAPANGTAAAEGPAPPLPEAMAGNFTPEAADHWHAAAGTEGDGSVDFGGESYSWHGRNGTGDGARPDIEHTATRPRTLREHLLEQIGTDLNDPVDRVIALHLLDLVDETSYLSGGLDAAAQLIGYEIGRVQAVFGR